MTAAVAAPAVPPSDMSALARRKRMDILHKTDSPAREATVAGAHVPPKKRSIRKVSEDSVPNSKKKKAKTCVTTTSKKEEPKKAQKKYDPDVPMTKEEAIAWRKEQRRKRNRESAANSRQKQRDRITELEAEVEGWKAKFADAMERLRKLEESKGISSSVPAQSPEDILLGMAKNVGIAANTEGNQVVSPCTSRTSSPQPSPLLSSVPLPSSIVATSKDQSGEPQEPKEEEQKPHLNETISRPA